MPDFAVWYRISPFGTGFHPFRSRIAPCKTFTPKKYGKARKDMKSGHPRMVSANARLWLLMRLLFQRLSAYQRMRWRDLSATATPAPATSSATTVKRVVPAAPVSGSWVTFFTFLTLYV